MWLASVVSNTWVAISYNHGTIYMREEGWGFLHSCVYQNLIENLHLSLTRERYMCTFNVSIHSWKFYHYCILSVLRTFWLCVCACIVNHLLIDTVFFSPTALLTILYIHAVYIGTLLQMKGSRSSWRVSSCTLTSVISGECIVLNICICMGTHRCRIQGGLRELCPLKFHGILMSHLKGMHNTLLQNNQAQEHMRRIAVPISETGDSCVGCWWLLMAFISYLQKKGKHDLWILAHTKCAALLHFSPKKLTSFLCL